MHSYYLVPKRNPSYEIVDLRSGRRITKTNPICIDVLAKLISQHVLDRYVYLTPHDFTDTERMITGRYMISGDLLSSHFLPELQKMFGQEFNTYGVVVQSSGFRVAFEQKNEYHGLRTSTCDNDTFVLSWMIDTHTCEIRHIVNQETDMAQYHALKSQSSMYKSSTGVTNISPTSRSNEPNFYQNYPLTPIEAILTPKALEPESEVIKVTVKKITVNTNLIQ